MVGIMIVKQNYGVMDWDCHCTQLPKQADRPVWVAGIDINTASLFFLVVEGGYVPVVYVHGYVVVLLRIVTCLIFHDIIWSHCVAFHWLGSLCFFFLFWNLISYTCILNHIRIIINHYKGEGLLPPNLTLAAFPPSLFYTFHIQCMKIFLFSLASSPFFELI